MSFSRVLGISMSFVGLLVGAGFATGQEVVQYFTSFGLNGVWGIIIAGIIMTLAGTVFLQLGSYFNAQEHNSVFRQVTHPIISRLLDIAVILTLFAVGFVMLAGAGSNMQQQFGWPAWIGSAVMLGMVLVVGMMDVNKVASVIGMITPSIIIAVIVAFAYTLLNLPDDLGATIEAASAVESPIGNWLVSALNYNGLALILAVSMSLVIGGDNLNPREAGWGGIAGGVLYSIMLVLAGFALILNSENVADSQIPMLTLVNEIHPVLGAIMAVIIYLMIFNTAIGMFYALGKRLSAGREAQYRIIFIVACLLGFAVSFLGFKTLMQYVYPVLGYMGIFMVAVLVIAWFRDLANIKDETRRRERIRALLQLKLRPDRDYDEGVYNDELGQHVSDSVLADAKIYDEMYTEVSTELSKDDEVELTAEELEELREDSETYVSRQGVERDRSPEKAHEWLEDHSGGDVDAADRSRAHD